MTKTGRNYSLDLVRITAALAVVMIHVSAGFVKSFEITTDEFQIANILDSLSRIGVPLFVMISGSLFLDENRKLNTKNIYIKNLKGILVLLFAWSLIYSTVFNIIMPLMEDKTVDIGEFLKDFVLGHYHMWYLYMIAGLYAMTPFLRQFVKKKNKKLIQLFLVVAVCAQFFIPILQGLSDFVPKVSILITLVNRFKLNFFCGYTVYYVLGWYVIHIGFKAWQKRIVIITSILSLLLTIFYVSVTKDYKNGYSNLNLFILLYASGMLQLLLSLIKDEPNRKVKKALILLSRMSFGVYIIHPMLITIAKLIVPYHAQPLRYMLLLYIVVVFVSFLICYLFSKMPLVRKLVRM